MGRRLYVAALGLIGAVACSAFGSNDRSSSGSTDPNADGGLPIVPGTPADGTLVIQPIGATTLVQGSPTDLHVVVQRGRSVDDLTISLAANSVGVTAPPLVLPAGVSDGNLTVTLAPDFAQGPTTLMLFASAKLHNADKTLSASVTVTASVRGKPGAVDTTFASAGAVSDVFGSYVTPTVLGLVNDAIFVAGPVPSNSNRTAAAHLSANGKPDAVYGGTGVASLAVMGIGTAALSGERFIVAGGSSDVVGAFDATGAPDTAFGTGIAGLGTVKLDQVVSYGTNAVLVDAAGGSVFIEQIRSGTDDYMVAVRLTPTGQVDGNFGPFGGGTANIGPARAIGSGLDAAGNIIGAGANDVGEIVVFGITATGALRPGFGASGITHLAVSGVSGSTSGIAVLPDGTFAVPFSRAAGAYVALVTANGKALVTNYGASNGIAGPFGPAGTTPSGVALTADGKLLVALARTATSAMVLRLDASGAADPSFGNGGIASFPLPASGSAVRVAAQKDGRIVVLAVQGSRTLVTRLWN